MILRTPRLAGVRSDYDRIIKQRNSLLKTAQKGKFRPGGDGEALDGALSTLAVWDEHLAKTGAELLVERIRLVEALRPYLGKAYETVARGASCDDADIDYKPSLDLDGVLVEREPIEGTLLAEIERRRRDEVDRGVSLVGPHRDELLLTLGNGDVRLPVKGYASHGESWSFALAMKLASYDLLRRDGDDPILIHDDVSAELDPKRPQQLPNTDERDEGQKVGTQ